MTEAEQRRLQDPFSDLWRRLCEARRKAFDSVRASGSPDDVYLAVVQAERAAFDAFLGGLPLGAPRD